MTRNRRPSLASLVLVAFAWTAPESVGATSVVQLPFVVGAAAVQSADTYRVDGRAVQLWGVEAPAANAICYSNSGRPWACGREALAAVTTYLKTRQLRCEYAQRTPDVIAWSCLTQPHNANLADWLVSHGWAKEVPGESYGGYRGSQKRAQDARLGIWKTGLDTHWK
jgi:endonuclease YncB( thermonuclease family)